jgi:hypothetical protein
MKKLVFLVVMTGLAAAALSAQTPTYVGAAKCAICHHTDSQGRQYPIWQANKHSQASATLGSPAAATQAQAMGVQNPASSPLCLGCHAPLSEKAPDLKSEGVTCEACHGPGSEYRKLSVMKDEALAVKSGLIAYGSKDAKAKLCLGCHENAHGLAFDFAAAWDKIKHPKPKA